MLALALSLPAVGLLLHPQLAPRCAGDAVGARAALRCSAEVTYGGIAHAGVIVSSTEVAKQVYTQVLGMEDETHIRSKKLPFPGAFVRAGEQQIHIMELPNPDPVDGRPEHGGARLTPHVCARSRGWRVCACPPLAARAGRDRHIALAIKDLAPLKQRLESHNVTFTMSKSGRASLFCRDPDGNAIEFMEKPKLEDPGATKWTG